MKKIKSLVIAAMFLVSLVAVINPVASRSGNIAYIHPDGDTSIANSYKALLEANGYSVILIPMSSVATTNFSVYNAIIIGSNTTSGDWNPALASAVNSFGKPIIGLGEDGGYEFFGELGLNTGRPNGWHGNDNSIYVVDPTHTIFNTPNAISIPPSNIIVLYTATNHVGIFLPSIPPSVVVLGREIGSATHYPLTLENNRYLLWGFHDSPNNMTTTGKDLFINVVNYMAPLPEEAIFANPIAAFMPVKNYHLRQVNAYLECIEENLPEDVPEDVQALLDEMQEHIDNANTTGNSIYANNELLKALRCCEDIREKLGITCPL